jgi:hypothetical protein
MVLGCGGIRLMYLNETNGTLAPFSGAVAQVTYTPPV